MASEDNDHDTSSIRPVSSLRAQFEDISINKGTPPAKAAKPAHLSNVEPERGRASLDIPSRTSRWGSHEQSPPGAIRVPEVNTVSKPLPRQITPGAASRQRPVSMGPWSPPNSPPLVTLQTPTMSPPKPVGSPNRMHQSFEQSTRQRDVKKSTETQQRIPTWPVQRDTGQDPSNSPLSRSRQPSPGNRKPPPPINRALKPGTPGAGASSGLEFGLGVAANASKEKISPFSTPPSGDESPIKDESPPKYPFFKSKNNSSSYFQPPAIYHTKEPRRESSANQNLSEYPQSRYPTNGSSTDLVEPRPGLPTRPKEFETPSQSTRLNANSIPPPIYPPRLMPAKDPSTRQMSVKSGVQAGEFLPPPAKRNLIPGPGIPIKEQQQYNPSSAVNRSSNDVPVLPNRIPTDEIKFLEATGNDSEMLDTDLSAYEAPNASQLNRRPPKTKCEAQRVWTQYDTKSLDICGKYVCTGGFVFRAWDISNARMITDYAPETKDLKITSFVFKPGGIPEEEGLYVWIGNNVGEIQEIDLKRQVILDRKVEAHGRRNIIKMFRHQNSIWSLDDDGKLLIWSGGKDGLPSLGASPRLRRLARGHTCSIIIKDYLWVAAGRNIYVYSPKGDDEGLNVTTQPLSHAGTTEITCVATISNQLDKAYFGHSDGKISMYSTTNFSCFGLISASPYRINCLAGAGAYLWAGFNTGMIYVYDTQSKPWKVKKEWHAHGKNSVSSICVDLSSVWKFGHLQVASLGADNAICFWDGMLEDDWIEHDMQSRDVEYCNFHEISAAIMTWNAGASTPGNSRQDQNNTSLFREAIRLEIGPDILVFGFQELVDLEDKKLTAKTIFKSSKKKNPTDTEHMSRQYRAWRDYLTQMVEEFTPQSQSQVYSLLHTASMVGLFSCIFIKSHLRGRVHSLKVAEIKRGLGGLHGNKGAIILRFILDDTSICFTNCHLAAGQSNTASRNSDITAILEADALVDEKDAEARINNYVGGGDGAMIMDHEICIINGDLNYRIDTMSRDTVIKAINSSNLAKLLERDQLLVSKRRNAGFRFRAFTEHPITFVPTYKYDVGTDRFDTSDKGRSPAWCDRILYRGAGRVKQLDYKRHELKLSDHRPVSGLFSMRIKTVDQRKRATVREQSRNRLAEIRENLSTDAKLAYLVNLLGVEENAARKMLSQQ